MVRRRTGLATGLACVSHKAQHSGRNAVATHVSARLLAAGGRIAAAGRASRRRAGSSELGCELEGGFSCQPDGMTSQRGKEGQLSQASRGLG